MSKQLSQGKLENTRYQNLLEETKAVLTADQENKKTQVVIIRNKREHINSDSVEIKDIK